LEIKKDKFRLKKLKHFIAKKIAAHDLIKYLSIILDYGHVHCKIEQSLMSKKSENQKKHQISTLMKYCAS